MNATRSQTERGDVDGGEITMSQEVKDKIFAIAKSKPQYEGVTQGELEHKHGFNRKEIDAALKELEKEGKLVAVPLFYSPQGRK
jgi:hypothetical protein